jgi:ribonuclease VapC
VIVVDASAVLAILLDEPEGDTFKQALLRLGGGVMSPVSHWEVLVRIRATLGGPGVQVAEALMTELGVEVRAATADHSRVAADAHVRFGRATPAKLNLGDCFAYALAVEQGDGLLFKGDGFTKTDVASALA